MDTLLRAAAIVAVCMGLGLFVLFVTAFIDDHMGGRG